MLLGEEGDPRCPVLIPHTRQSSADRWRELVRAGRTPEELLREFEPSAQTISNWVTRADLDEGKRTDGLTTDEREELRRLRRENRILREERTILSRAAAWFAQETGSTPGKSSSS